MSAAEGKTFLKVLEGGVVEGSYAVTPDQLNEKAGAALTVTASSKARKF